MSAPSADPTSDRLRFLEARLGLIQGTDHVADDVIASGGSPEELVRTTLPLLRDALGALRVGASVLDRPEIADPAHPVPAESGARIDRILELGGRPCGKVWAELPSGHDLREAEILLDAWSEVLDDPLALYQLAEDKHATGRTIARALLDPRIERGVDEALSALLAIADIDDVIVVFRPADGSGSLHHRWLAKTSDGLKNRARDPLLLRVAADLLKGDTQALRESLGADGFRQEELLFGIRQPKVIGRLLAARRGRPLPRYEQELLQVLADALRQRLADFSREHAQLASCFPPRAVRHLLDEADYRERFLSPREAEVAILYADIAGFTRISEQLLATPSDVGRLIDAWGNAVVRTVWATGGVFDKMVGDCVIALWGPPFYEFTPAEACRAALEAAQRIRLVTQELPLDPRNPELAHLEGQLGVSIGLHYTPLCVGQFGPNANFTGFSSGMNDTARLQGVAACNEILAMTPFVEQVGFAGFGPELRATVKNVADPLRYRTLV